MENLKSYQSAYATLTAEITANLSKIGQNLKLDHLPEDSVGEKIYKNNFDKFFREIAEIY